ncbi:MAG: Ribonuclease HI [Candidatus Heimdallarchaeota archaeon LC_3]|nr:MAG: Ribonuclease HI [Candidatus Heimdallarchaeota archaeon LC_3]
MTESNRTGTIWFDGASRGNPGKSGAGAVFLSPSGEEFTNYSYLDIATNNLAEYTGLKLGIELAVKYIHDHKEDKFEKLIIYGDSELIIKQLTGEYRVKNERLKVLYDDIQLSLKEIKSNLPDIEIDYKHLPRELNKKADSLANRAIDTSR